MATYSTQYDIANRALVHCGISPNLTSAFTGSKNAVLMGFLYDKIRVAELRKHVWNFAITYSQLAAASPATVRYANGQVKNAWALPADYIRIATQDPRNAGVATLLTTAGIRFNDYQVEGANLITSGAAPSLRYVNNFTTVTSMDPTFCEMVAASLALASIEVITQNPTKRQLIEHEYMSMLDTARTINLIEGGSAEPSEPDIKLVNVPRPGQLNAAPPAQQQGRA